MENFDRYIDRAVNLAYYVGQEQAMVHLIENDGLSPEEAFLLIKAAELLTKGT